MNSSKSRLAPIFSRYIRALLILLQVAPLLVAGETATAERKPLIGVVYVIHGGTVAHTSEGLWSATLQIFAYDPHSPVYQRVIWNPEQWPRVLNFGNAPKERGKYAFEYARIGGVDPASGHTAKRLQQLRAQLAAREAALGVEFIVDYAAWIASEPKHHVYPRALYRPGVPNGQPLTYCGSKADGGRGPDNTWPGCDPWRFNTDGTIERMLDAGVDAIIMIDMTTSGVRFFKTYDVVRTAREVVAAHNKVHDTNIGLYWVNDPNDLMRDSYPDKPAGWTRSLGVPEHDPSVPLANHPNPVSSDPRLAAFHVEGIEHQFRAGLPLAKTGVLLVNHATRALNHLFDPKVDDTLVLNRNIKRLLLAHNPQIDPDNIVGGWMGIKEHNPAIRPGPPQFSQLERTRRMRGENLGYAYLYESDEQLPGGEWRYRYWDALDRLRQRGVEHIVVAFPQIMVDSVLNLVELPNQIAREIGSETSMYAKTLDFQTYPEFGHPFADYWGNWVDTRCRYPDQPDIEQDCCFAMGGCTDGRVYPPPRQTPENLAMDDLEPSLAWDIPAFGHSGYDPSKGPPSHEKPVQQQYRGTWSIWEPPNSNPEVAVFLADHVIEFIQSRIPGIGELSNFPDRRNDE
jgi:hypothetical protein